MTGWEISQFNIFKYYSSSLFGGHEGKTNDFNGMQSHAQLFFLTNFNGGIYVVDNTISDVRARIVSSSQFCSSDFFAPHKIAIYGNVDIFMKIYTFYLNEIQ